MSKYYQADIVRKNLKEVLKKYKVRDEFADIVSRSLVKASLRGVHSHGVALINRYINERELENYYQKYQEFKNNLKKNFDKLPIFPPNNNIINQINYLEKKKYFFD